MYDSTQHHHNSLSKYSYPRSRIGVKDWGRGGLVRPTRLESRGLSRAKGIKGPQGDGASGSRVRAKWV